MWQWQRIRQCLDLCWWDYLFEAPTAEYFVPFWRVILCRIRLHPNGRIFYNSGGLEPDDRCKDCGDKL